MKRKTRPGNKDKHYVDEESDLEVERVVKPACKGETKRRKVVKRKENVEKENTEQFALLDNREVVVEHFGYSEKELKEASLLIRKCYLGVEEEYEKQIENELKNEFTALTNQPITSACAPKNRPRFSMRQKHYELYATRSKVSRIVGNETETQIVGCEPIKSLITLPQMSYWVHIESNIKTEDNLRLTHVPYLKEDQNDEDLCAQLIDLFEEGIHGYSDNWKYINDVLLHRVISACLKQYTGKKDVLFYAFYQLFPNKYSHRQLPDIYAKLTSRFEDCRSLAKDGETNPKFPPDPSSDIHSIFSTNCTQCSTYDCVIHGFRPHITNKFIGGRWKPVMLPLVPKGPKNTCSDDCWKHNSNTRIFEHLQATAENASEDRLPVFFDLTEVTRLPEQSGSSFITAFVFNEEAQSDFCHYATTGARDMVGNGKWSCKRLFEQVLKYSQRPSGLRLHADREKAKVDPSQMHKQFRTLTWQSGVGEVQNKYRMHPCDHAGPCGSSNSACTCNKNGVCTKFCSCDDNCKMKFPGCRCAPGQCRTKQCQCFYAKWECDPIICKSCKCGLVSDKGCRNSGIGKGLQKRIAVLPSPVAGWGAYIMEDVEKGDLVSEYTGEIISSSEVERRGHIYDQFKTSYIFALNEDECVDAYKMGNLIRFANHSDTFSNCYSKILIVNGCHRIGIFAKKDLKKGDELLFDYSYNKQHKDEFVANDQFGINRKKSKSTKRAISEVSSTSESSKDSEDSKYQKKTARKMRKV